jgi:Kef-type K+ transport system membrane component KefB
VVGEIVAGLVLGASLLGLLAPDVFRFLFRPEIHGLSPALSEQLLRWVLSMLSQIGLVFLLFLIGLEFELGHLRQKSKAAVAISLSGIAAPFLLGVALTPLLLSHPDLVCFACSCCWP